jgi:hypothetical protein
MYFVEKYEKIKSVRMPESCPPSYKKIGGVY